jgi:hypothetical protein
MNSHGESVSPDGIYYSLDVCIGTGQVSMLIWMLPDEFIYVKPYDATIGE